MKTLRALAVLLSISCLSTMAHAAPIDPTDFRFQVLDPAGPPGVSITSPTLTGVSFGTCSTGTAPSDVLSATPGDGQDGCFFATNNTGATITAINLFFENTMDSDDPSDFTYALDGQSASCETSNDDINTNSGYTPAFGSAPTCSIQQDGNYELTYNMGAGIAPGATLVLVELDVAPDAFIEPSDDTDTVTLAPVTPEPNSIVLLSTGVLCIGLMVAKRRFTSLNLGQ